MKKELLAQLIDEALEKKLQSGKVFQGKESFPGYNPIEKIRGGLFHWVLVPFNRQEIWCQLRCPNQTQLDQCGDVSNIILDREEGKEFDHDELINIKNYQEELCKIVFNRPTFDEIAALVGTEDFVLSAKRKELEEINKKFEENKASMSEMEKDIIATQVKTLELQIGYIIPDDTMAFITNWAMGNDISDIKRISKEEFLKAATLAKLHNKAPSDYISGNYTDFNKNEIDSYAAHVLAEHLREHEATRQSKHDWFLDGRRRAGGSFIPRAKGG